MTIPPWSNSGLPYLIRCNAELLNELVPDLGLAHCTVKKIREVILPSTRGREWLYKTGFGLFLSDPKQSEMLCLTAAANDQLRSMALAKATLTSVHFLENSPDSGLGNIQPAQLNVKDADRCALRLSFLLFCLIVSA